MSGSRSSTIGAWPKHLREGRHAALRFRYVTDQGALALSHIAWSQSIAGNAKPAYEAQRNALVLTARLGHPHTSAHVLCVLATAAQIAGDVRATGALANAARKTSLEHGFPFWLAWSDFVLGWVEGRRRLDRAWKCWRKPSTAIARLARSTRCPMR